MQEKNWMTEEELRRFEIFAVALDSAIVNKHHMVLQDLKVCKGLFVSACLIFLLNLTLS